MTPQKRWRWTHGSTSPHTGKPSATLKSELIRKVQQLARLGVTRADIRDYLKLTDKMFTAAWKGAASGRRKA